MVKKGASDWRDWLTPAEREYIASTDAAILKLEIEIAYQRSMRNIYQRRAMARRGVRRGAELQEAR